MSTRGSDYRSSTTSRWIRDPANCGLDARRLRRNVPAECMAETADGGRRARGTLPKEGQGVASLVRAHVGVPARDHGHASAGATWSTQLGGALCEAEYTSSLYRRETATATRVARRAARVAECSGARAQHHGSLMRPRLDAEYAGIFGRDQARAALSMTRAGRVSGARRADRDGRRRWIPFLAYDDAHGVLYASMFSAASRDGGAVACSSRSTRALRGEAMVHRTCFAALVLARRAPESVGAPVEDPGARARRPASRHRHARTSSGVTTAPRIRRQHRGERAARRQHESDQTPRSCEIPAPPGLPRMRRARGSACGPTSARGPPFGTTRHAGTRDRFVHRLITRRDASGRPAGLSRPRTLDQWNRVAQVQTDQKGVDTSTNDPRRYDPEERCTCT